MMRNFVFLIHYCNTKTYTTCVCLSVIEDLFFSFEVSTLSLDFDYLLMCSLHDTNTPHINYIHSRLSSVDFDYLLACPDMIRVVIRMILRGVERKEASTDYVKHVMRVGLMYVM